MRLERKGSNCSDSAECEGRRAELDGREGTVVEDTGVGSTDSGGTVARRGRSRSRRRGGGRRSGVDNEAGEEAWMSTAACRRTYIATHVVPEADAEAAAEDECATELETELEAATEVEALGKQEVSLPALTVI